MIKQTQAAPGFASLDAFGRLADGSAQMEALGGKLDEFLAQQESAAFSSVCRLFELSEGESAALAWCAARAAANRPLPDALERAALYRAGLRAGSGESAPNLLLEQDELLNAACDVILGRAVRLPAYLRFSPDAAQPGLPVFHGQQQLEECRRFLSRCVESDDALPAMVALTGEEGSGRKFLFAELARGQGCSLLLADCRGMGQRGAAAAAGIALLFDAMVCLENYTDGDAPLAQELFSWFSVVLAAARHPVAPPAGCRALLEREIPALTAQESARALGVLLPAQLSEQAAVRAASAGRLSAGRIVTAAARLRAECLAGENDAEGALIGLLGREGTAALERCAEPIRTDKRLCDLVLAPEQAQQLRNLIDFVAGRDTIWKRWGFETKVPYGRGITALFYGSSGTGKTLAASAMANELGMRIYRVDLSQLISKYVGETQKNIKRVFDDAQNTGCILFFDEADALFSRRSEATDAQDRYANAEIAYLLQRTEQYDGVILLATNLLQNFDEAFRRRIGFMIHFPMPDAAQREALWRGIFPQQAPLEEIDYPLLAEQLELSGASIRSCAVNAACLAAAGQSAVGMRHIATAARMEYQKLGRAFPAKLAPMLLQEGRRQL